MYLGCVCFLVKKISKVYMISKTAHKKNNVSFSKMISSFLDRKGVTYDMREIQELEARRKIERSRIKKRGDGPLLKAT